MGDKNFIKSVMINAQNLVNTRLTSRNKMPSHYREIVISCT